MGAPSCVVLYKQYTIQIKCVVSLQQPNYACMNHFLVGEMFRDESVYPPRSTVGVNFDTHIDCDGHILKMVLLYLGFQYLIICVIYTVHNIRAK